MLQAGLSTDSERIQVLASRFSLDACSMQLAEAICAFSFELMFGR